MNKPSGSCISTVTVTNSGSGWVAPPITFNRRPLVYSYTFLNTYKNCPYQAYRRYILKDQPYIETPAMKWGNEVHSVMEYRVAGGKPLPEKMRQWEPFAIPFDGKGAKTEQKLAIDVDGNESGYFDQTVWLRGRIDVALVGPSAAYICDWKTGNSKYEDPFELEVNALLLQARYPDLKTIKAQYVWLKEERLGKPYDVSVTDMTWGTVKAIVENIETDRAAGEFKKKKSGLCGYCSVADCENNTNPEVKK